MGGRPLAVVAMSGGVDSSVAAALLLEAGYGVEGVSLRLWDSSRRDDRVCSDHRDASRVAGALGIAHTQIDQRQAFESVIVEPFVAEYARGRTPNPCVACNGDFKLGRLVDWAVRRGADFVATGHYARLQPTAAGVALCRARDSSRDQSYFLFSLAPRQLARALFPLGDWTKADVRRRAAALGLPVAAKPDSQDLCFGNPGALVRSRGMGGGRGEIVDEAGHTLGLHDGIESFTVGQRRGLGVATGARMFVRSLDAREGRVVVGPNPPRVAAVVASGWSWTGEPADRHERLFAQVRYRHRPASARVSLEGAGRARVDFDEPVLAAAPGQAVVVYRGDQVVGGGWIAATIRPDEAA
ncbi:MAG: tRNA 2-thiouridine(34) synthase MnmA [Candidatus Binatia bacterium]